MIDSKKNTTLVCYSSWSGNTKEVAELIAKTLHVAGEAVELHHIGLGPIPDIKKYESIYIGSFTWDRGSTPDEVKDFALDVGYKPEQVYVFGTGDTQFGGDDLFCLAAVKLAKFYNSPLEPLLIEQSPRGSQESLVHKWTLKTLENTKSKRETLS